MVPGVLSSSAITLLRKRELAALFCVVLWLPVGVGVCVGSLFCGF